MNVFDTSLPPEILSLDVGGRDLTLDAMDGDLVGAARHLAALGETWAAVRDEVVNADGDRVADDVDELLAALLGGIEASDLDGLRAQGDRGRAGFEALRDLYPPPRRATWTDTHPVEHARALWVLPRPTKVGPSLAALCRAPDRDTPAPRYRNAHPMVVCAAGARPCTP